MASLFELKTAESSVRVDTRKQATCDQGLEYSNILKYQRDVARHKPSQTLTIATVSPGLFDRSFADVTFIAGMLVEKCRYHLPLYRQHQRLEASGITVNRGTLTNLEQRACVLYNLLPMKC